MNAVMRLISEACDQMNENGFASGHRVVPLEKFDFQAFKAQPCDIEGIEIEYVNQSGPGMAGDDFTGTIGFPIGGQMFVVDYS